jgi:hypothetical protein
MWELGMKKAFVLSIIILFMCIQNSYPHENTSFQIPGIYNKTIQEQNTDKMLPSEMISALSQEETILLKSNKNNPDDKEPVWSYFIKTGGSFALHDKTFREFLDYGATISLGVEQKITEKLSATPTIDIVMLKGKWQIGEERQYILTTAQEWFAGYLQESGQQFTEEDVPDENLGQGYGVDAVGIITSAELLQNLDIETTLFLLPITFNAKYWIHKDKAINPFVGGGLGFCLARRDVRSRAVKEESFEGPLYRIDLNESQFVTGIVLQFLAGFEIPFKDTMKLTVEANTALYDLKKLDPILEITDRTAVPGWYTGSESITTFSYEEPLEVGVFNYEFVSSIMLALSIPF